MKRVLSIICLFCLFVSLVGCQSNDSSSILSNSNVKSGDIDYSDEFRNVALELMRNKETNSGFNIVGTVSDQNKADYIETLFTELNLSNVRQEPILLDGWSLTDVSMSFACDCDDSGILTLHRIGVYPSNFSYNATDFDVVYIENGVEKDYSNIDIKNKGVLLGKSVDIKQSVDLAIEKGAAFVIYPYISDYSPVGYKVDVSLDLPTTIPIFVLSKGNFNTVYKYLDENKMIRISLTGTSVLSSNVESSFVIGEIEGKKKDKYVYVTANRDSIDSGFMSSNLNVAELYLLAKELKESNFKPYYTIRFMVTTGQEWGSISKNEYNIGISKYLETFENLEDIQSVLVIDGSKPLEGKVVTETQIGNSEEIRGKLETYNTEFKEKEYRFINVINEVSDMFITEGLVWYEKNVPVVIQAEPMSSEYKEIEDTSLDNPELGIDKVQSQFLIEYYMGVIKLLSSK